MMIFSEVIFKEDLIVAFASASISNLSLATMVCTIGPVKIRGGISNAWQCSNHVRYLHLISLLIFFFFALFITPALVAS